MAYIIHWFSDTRGFLARALRLFKATWRDCLPAGLLLAGLPTLLIFAQMSAFLSAQGFSGDALFALLSGDGFPSGTRALAGQQALSNMSLLETLRDYAALPMLFAMLSLILCARWKGARVTARETIGVLKTYWWRVLLCALTVTMAMGIARMAIGLVSLLVNMALALIAALPYLAGAALVLRLVFALMLSALEMVLTHALMMFAVCALLRDGMWGRGMLMQVVGFLMRGRRPLLRQFGGVAACWLAGGGVLIAALWALWLAGLPMMAVWLIAALSYGGGITLSCAAYVYMYCQESEIQSGDRTVVEAEVL